jgi:Mn-dependent DtxR family transcriptional regulator
MRSAIWLYFYLIGHADRRTGTLYRRIPTIAHDMRVNPATISRWMAKLASRGYIVLRRTGRALQITIER